MKPIPSGTVTFLFTDIEGSTGLWERFPEAMRQAFPRQETILRETVARHGGYPYKMIGDAFQVAFDTAPQAVAAALEAQLALQSEPWGQTPIRVRMALHTAVTEERGDDYVGPALNRLGRLLSCAYGGQVLLSQTTGDLVRDNLPTAAALRDLGEHRLNDLARAEHIYQLEAPGLQAVFPHLKIPEAFPHNLPLARTSFIGRESELAAIKQLLGGNKTRLVTLTGAGGTGKTRLALRAAADLLESFPDGVWLAELAPLADPLLVLQTVAAAVGAREAAGRAMQSILIEHLRPRRLLLILDNCEHVVEASARLADALLQACPNLQILATSREILGSSGEVPFRVPSLSTPDLRHLPRPAQLAGFEAVRLFLERAAQVSPGFALTDANAPVIARICSRLDGIPLAIELAAARVRMLSVEQIAGRLDDSFRLLTGGSRTVLPRHQTLKALIDWSYQLLQPQERKLLLRLSVFAGGWSLQAAEEVCGDDEGLDVFGLLSQLVDKSLVIASQREPAETRYRMLETIRQYAREKAPEMDGAEKLHERHLDYFIKLSIQAEPQLRARDQAAWLELLELELDNLRQALEWALFSRQQDGLQMATRLLWFWHIRGHGVEGIDWLERLLQEQTLQTANQEEQLSRAMALEAGGFLLHMQNESEKSRRFLLEGLEIVRGLGGAGERVLAGTLLRLASVTEGNEPQERMYMESLAISRRLDETFLMAEALQNLGGLKIVQGDFAQARVFLAENLALRRRLDDLDGTGTTWLQLGYVNFVEDNNAEAQRDFEAALECFSKVGNLRFASEALFSQAMISFAQGDFEQASQKCEQAIAIGQEMREKAIVAVGLFRLGRVSVALGNYDLAVSQYHQVWKIARETNFRPLMAIAPFGLAVVAVSQGQYPQAYEHMNEAIEVWREIGDVFDSGLSLLILAELAFVMDEAGVAAQLFGAAEHFLGTFALRALSPLEVRNYLNIQRQVREKMGDADYEQALAAGRELPLKDALELALSLGWQVR